MKPLKTKAQVRAELDAQINAYLTEGGDINDVPRGQSGVQNNTNVFTQQASESSPKQERTPLAHVVKEMDERKQAGKKTVSGQAGASGRRHKVLIKDDFGEPVRWVWVDGD